jgi:hypothetical protein
MSPEDERLRPARSPSGEPDENDCKGTHDHDGGQGGQALTPGRRTATVGADLTPAPPMDVLVDLVDCEEDG